MENTSKIEFKLTVHFTGEFPEERVKELMHKVTDALYHEYAHGNGFAPDGEDDCLTEGVKLKFNDIHLVDRYYVSDNGRTGERKTDMIDFSGK
jgi:hypothetical protein